jgi:hypothetical protein
MGMNTICHIKPTAPRTRASRFMERYSACRGSLARELVAGRADASSRPATTSAGMDGDREQSFLQAFSRAFAAARQ